MRQQMNNPKNKRHLDVIDKKFVEVVFSYFILFLNIGY